jgi:DNA-binding transcriptional LysR family regulator
MKKTTPESKPAVDFDLRQLEIFRRVVELESFSKAAEVVFLAQASVSERIANLENMLGLKLLDRLGRRVVPTKAGELLYKHALNLLEMKRLACAEMEDFLGIRRGEVRIGGSTIPGEYILPKAIALFREKSPLASVRLTIADSGEIEKRVLDGDLELGVIGSKRTRGNLASHELWKDELVLAVPSQHRYAKRNSVSITELVREPFILRESGSGTLRTLEDYLQNTGPEGINALNVVARLGSSTSVKEGIKAGLGVSILSYRALGEDVRTGAMTALRVRGLPMSRRFYLIIDRRRTPSPMCLALRDFLLSTSKLL